MTDPKKALCFDDRWKYTRAVETDLSKTFARVRRQMKEQAKAPPNVQPLKKKEPPRG